jgi:hypothetical protein
MKIHLHNQHLRVPSKGGTLRVRIESVQEEVEPRPRRQRPDMGNRCVASMLALSAAFEALSTVQ